MINSGVILLDRYASCGELLRKPIIDFINAFDLGSAVMLVV